MSARLTAKNLEESERVFQLAQKTHQDAQKDVRKATWALENCEKKITELDSNPRLTRDKDRKRRDLDAMLVVQRTILEQAKLREKTMFGNLARAENDLEKAKALLGAVECVGGGGDSHTNDANNGFGSSDLSDIDEEPDATRVETSKTTEKPLTRNKRKEVPGGHTTEHSSSKKAKAFVGPSSRANKNVRAVARVTGRGQNTKRRPVLTGDQSVNTPAKEASESSETSNAVNANVDGSADTSSMVNATQSPNVDGPGGHPTATALADGGTGVSRCEGGLPNSAPIPTPVSRDHGEPANTPRMPDIDKSAGHRTPNPASSPSTSFSPSNGGMPATAPPGDNPLDLQAHLTASWPPLTTSQPSSPKSSCTADGSAVRDIDAATEDSAPPGKVLYDHDMLLEWMRENPQGFWNQPDVTSGYGEAPDDRSVTDPPTLHLPSTTNKGKSKDLAISTPSGTDSLAPSAQTHKGVLHVDASDSDVTRSTASNRDVVTVRAALQGPSAGQLFDGDSDIIMASSGDQETRNGSANDVSPSTVEINFRDFVVKQDVDNEDDMVLVQDLSPTSLIREIMKNTMTSATTKVSHMQVKKTVAKGKKASKKTTGRKRGKRPGQRVPATEVESQDDDTTPTSKTFDSNAPDTPDDEDDKDYEDEEDEGDDSDEEKTLYNQKSDEDLARYNARMAELADQAVDRFMANPRDESKQCIPYGIRRWIRERAENCPRAGLLCVELTIHILTTKWGLVKCDYHHYSDKSTKKNDLTSVLKAKKGKPGLSGTRVTGVPQTPVLKMHVGKSPELGYCHCGCEVERAVGGFYMWKSLTVESPTLNIKEGFNDTHLVPRDRNLLITPLEERSQLKVVELLSHVLVQDGNRPMYKEVTEDARKLVQIQRLMERRAADVASREMAGPA